MIEDSADKRDVKQAGTRERLMAAMVQVVGSEGLHAASVRTIAKLAGCNEAVLYQHFPSKLAMQQAIYEEIVAEMAEDKKHIAETVEDPREFITRWVETTYAFYDAKPYAFAYVYLSYPPVEPSNPEYAGLNSRIFKEAISRMTAPDGHSIDLSETTLAVVRAALLGPPRDLHAGVLAGNAIDHVAEAARCLQAILSRPNE